MPLQHEHDFLVTGSHDEMNRQHYVSRLRMHILNQIGGGMRDVYESRVKPTFEKENGRIPKNETEIHKAMMADHYGRTWSTMMVNCQDMVWDSVRPGIERAQPDLNERVRGVNARFGSLALNPDVEMPRYLDAADIHRMPGNYHAERAENDATQGALYDRGRFVYNGGAAGPFADGIPRTMAAYIKARWPDFKPKRILELGCTIGTSTVPFVDAFPDAEVHAIDVSAPSLRYGHARAETLEKPIHFHQMNAEDLDFEDGSFDLIYSCIIFHETSRKAYPKILEECQRVLSTGGMMAHTELTPVANMDDFDAFYIDWDAYYNNEPFYKTYTSLDPEEWVTGAGFEQDKFFQVSIPDLDRSSPEFFDEAVKNPTVAKGRAARVGESARWYTYGAWK
ncbi:MAG: class I SAM-dependent methyltransferase [Rhodospirillaceae bacterium]|nr:class I SAM-dependent methyltransferase [Rhodospirillaceae bacterium]